MDALKQVVNVFIKYQLVQNELECTEDAVEDIYEKVNKTIHIHNDTKPQELDEAITKVIKGELVEVH